MKLSMLTSGIEDIKIIKNFDSEITSVCVDSKKCGPGSLFVAVRGCRVNGNDFLQDAYARGARAFVTSDYSASIPNSSLIYSKNPRKTLAELSAKISGNPEKKMLFVGITGTKGKTTTAMLLSKMLDGMGIKNVSVGTLGVSGIENITTVNTTPCPTVLFPIFKKAYKSGTKVVILEVSSQAIKEFRIFGIQFDCVAFTGLGADHIGAFEHPSLADYIYSKRQLFTSYGAKRAVINYDDAYSSYMAAGIPKIIKCGFTVSSDLRITDFSDTADGAVFSLSGVNVKSALPGEYNARNAAVALGLVREITGKSISDAARYLSDTKVPGRFEVCELEGRHVIIDYAHNEESLRAVAELSKRLFGNRIICVFGSVGERSYKRRIELATAAEKFSDFSVITSDNPGFEFPLGICADIYSGFNDKTKAKIIVRRDLAILYALNESRPGDAVLVLGRGHEKSINQSGRNISFSDRSFVENLMDKSRKALL